MQYISEKINLKQKIRTQAFLKTMCLFIKPFKKMTVNYNKQALLFKEENQHFPQNEEYLVLPKKKTLSDHVFVVIVDLDNLFHGEKALEDLYSLVRQ